MIKYIITFVIGFVFGILLMVMSNIQRGDPLDQAYERGYEDAHWFVKYDIEVNPTVVVDNLGRTWYRADSTEGWYGWDVSEALARDWYDRAADSTHRMYEKAFQAWATSLLLRGRTFVIYFDSTDTLPAVEPPSTLDSVKSWFEIRTIWSPPLAVKLGIPTSLIPEGYKVDHIDTLVVQLTQDEWMNTNVLTDCWEGSPIPFRGYLRLTRVTIPYSEPSRVFLCVETACLKPAVDSRMSGKDSITGMSGRDSVVKRGQGGE